MLLTAKSIQLLDASALNISPVTDITSLYYEVERRVNDTSIVARKFVYPNFPVQVNMDPCTYINDFTSETSQQSQLDLCENGKPKKIVNSEDNSDILVSHVETNIIPGTTLRKIDVSQYNLSEILYNYTPIALMNASMGNVNSSINNINSSINNINSSISNLFNSLNASDGDFKKILDLQDANLLVPNKIYVINDYYYGDGCMAIPNSNNFSGPNNEGSLKIYTKAITRNKLDNKIYNMSYKQNGQDVFLDVYGNYVIEGNRLHITYLRDKWNNEGNFDFYNLKRKKEDNQTFNCFQIGESNNSSNMLFNNSEGNIRNNIFRLDPYKHGNENVYLCVYKANPTTRQIVFQNNIIDHDTKFDLVINAGYNSLFVIGNNIGQSTSFIVSKSGDAVTNASNFIQNCVIMNNCSIGIYGNGTYINFKDSVIGNNNIVNIGTGFSKLVMNSSNNITFTNTSGELNNVVIMSNCQGNIEAANNIIVDNKPAGTLNASSNCAYLYGQTIYANSFNAIN